MGCRAICLAPYLFEKETSHMAETTAPVASEPASLWRHADFMKLWIGESVSALGSQFTTLAIPLIAALALLSSGYIVTLIAGWKKLVCSRKEKIRLIMSGIAGLIMISNVIFWEAYRF
jgi:hypothetical protein